MDDSPFPADSLTRARAVDEACDAFESTWLGGGTLAQKCAGVPQPPRDAARLIETLARAIHQAHLAGIVHRDLKPANVLLTKDGVPKIADFGLAKQYDADHAATASGVLLGTPQYMAPEQASGGGRVAAPAVDVHALGAILYELLTGRPPYQEADLTELLQAICQREPTSLRLVKQSVPHDLETICLKCLQKLPSARYDSAAELADDLQRYLGDQPIRARPVSSLEKGWRWCRRNPWVAAPMLTLLVVLLSVSIGSVIAANIFRKISEEAADATRLADRRALETRRELARSNVNEARMLRRSGRVGQYVEALAKVQAARDEFRALEREGLTVEAADWEELRDEAASTTLVPDLLTVGRWRRASSEIPEVAVDLVRRRYVRITAPGEFAELCRIGSDEPYDRIAAPAGSRFEQALFSAAGNRLVLFTPNESHFWDVRGEPTFLRRAPRYEHWRMISLDGSVYVAGAPQTTTALFMRVADGAVTAATPLGAPLFGFPFHPQQPWAALTSGSHVLVFDYERKREVWRQKVTRRWQNAAWSQDGRTLVLTESTGALQAFAAEDGMLRGAELNAFDAQGVFSIPASRAGMIATTDWSGSLRLFSQRTGRLQLKSSVKFFDHPATLGPDGGFSLAYDEKDYVLHQPRGSRLTEFARQGTSYVAMSHSGRFLVVCCEPQGAQIFHLPSCEHLATIPGDWGDLPLGFEAEDRALLLYGKGRLHRVPWDEEAGTGGFLRLGPPELMAIDSMRDRWGVSRDGAVIAAPQKDRGGVVYRDTLKPNTATAAIVTPPQQDVRSAAVSPDGRWLVLGSHVRGKVSVYSAEDGSHLRDLMLDGGFGTFSPDGRWLLVSRFAGGGELYSVEDWTPRGRLNGQLATFSPDGRLLAVESEGSTIELLETEGLRKIGRLEIQDQSRLRPCCFTPDGAGLVVSTEEERRLLYFDLAGVRDDLRTLELDWSYPSIPRATTEVKSIPAVRFVLAVKEDAAPPAPAPQ